jgi:hypothetical protein
VLDAGLQLVNDHSPEYLEVEGTGAGAMVVAGTTVVVGTTVVGAAVVLVVAEYVTVPDTVMS